MAQTKREIRDLLAQAGSEPRKRFGQNFMIDGNLLRLVADAGEVQADDLVIEVGPGTGTLTEELLNRGARVLAVEIDRDLAQLLRTKFAENARFELIEGDALAGKHRLNQTLVATLRPPGTTKLVANLPYNIASPLIVELLCAGVSLLAFTVQREVAERLRATAGGEAYGPLSAMVQLLGHVELLRTLPPQAFWPSPRVESALVRIRGDNRLGERAAGFSEFLSKLFAARRKTLRKALSQMDIDAGAALERLHIDPQLRPEVLSPEQLLQLYGEAALRQ